MVKLQHERTRGPGEIVLVNGTKYEIDEQGNIECSEKDAEKLQMSPKWRPPEHWEAIQHKVVAATPPPSAAGGARRVRTKEELFAMADVNGIPLEEAEKPAEAIKAKDSEAKQVDAEQAEKAAAELKGQEVITVSEDMSKVELLKLAADVGIKAHAGMKKSEILDLFEQNQ